MRLKKLFQSVGYSVDKQLAQALKEIEALNQELENDGKIVIKPYLWIVTKLKKS